MPSTRPTEGRSLGGAGPAGGLLFIAVLLFVAYLVLAAVAGPLRYVLGAAFLVVVAVLLWRVLQRR